MKFPLTTSKFSRNRENFQFSEITWPWPSHICSLNGHWLSSCNLLELTWKDHNFFPQFPVCIRLIYSRKVVWPQPDGASGFSMVIQATLVLLVHWYSSISVPKRKLPSIQSRLRTKKGHDWLHGGFLFGIEIGGYQWKITLFKCTLFWCVCV